MELIWNFDRNSNDIANLIAIIDGQKNNVLFLRKSASGYSSIPSAGFDFLKPKDIPFEEVKLLLKNKYDNTLSQDEYEVLEPNYVCSIVEEDFEDQIKKILSIY